MIDEDTLEHWHTRPRVVFDRWRLVRRVWAVGIVIAAVAAFVVWLQRTEPIVVSEAEMARRIPAEPALLPLVAPMKPAKRAVHSERRSPLGHR